MGYKQAVPAGPFGKHRHHDTPRVPGGTASVLGLVIIFVFAALLAIGLGGSGAAGALWLGIFIGIGLVAYSMYRRMSGMGPVDKRKDDAGLR